MLAELERTPCSPHSPIWLLYGVQPRKVPHATVPGVCKGKAHRPEHLGIASRRVLVSRKWSNKTLDDHHAERTAFVRQLLIKANVRPGYAVDDGPRTRRPAPGRCSPSPHPLRPSRSRSPPEVSREHARRPPGRRSARCYRAHGEGSDRTGWVDQDQLTRAQKALLAHSGDVAERLAEDHGVCVRPLAMRRLDLTSGRVDVVPVPCGSRWEDRCRPGADKNRRLRMTQCREGWHLDHEPVPKPAEPIERQKDLIIW